MQRERQQAHGDLLPRGDHDIVLGTVVLRPGDLIDPVRQLVGGPCHRGHHHGDPVAGIAGALDARGDGSDPVHVGHRRAAELLHHQRQFAASADEACPAPARVAWPALAFLRVACT